MGLAEVQRALARLYIDPRLRDRFFAEPVVAGVELGLDSEDVRGLAKIPRRQIEQFADSLKQKRHDQVRRVVPIAAEAIGDRTFINLFDEYCAESVPRGSTADLDDAVGFVESIRRRGDRVAPPWAVDLARYELAWRQAVRAGRAPMLRIFRFPVGRLAIGPGCGPVAPRWTLGFWWRPIRRVAVRHVVLSMPGIGFGYK
jgi:hypothetical protein